MNKKVRDVIIAIVLLTILMFTIMYQHQITYFIVHNILYKNDIVTYPANEYKRDYSFNYVQETTNYIANSKQDIMNIFYSMLNNGWETFTFYCDEDYTSCQTDIDELSSGTNDTFANINNFVAPYNSFSKIQITTNTLGKIRIDVDYIYSKEEIVSVNTVAKAAYKNLTNDSMSTKEKIEVLHDYIIGNSIYDIERANKIQEGLDDSDSKYQSNIAYGPLIQGYAICGGYADSMAIFLDMMRLKNYRVMTLNHIWNYVEIDGQWYHIDLTWDDPVIDNNKQQVILHNFFLLKTAELDALNAENHTYNKEIYSE